MEPRKAFSFYRSYYEAACLIGNKEQRADFYHAIFKYVFEGETQVDLIGVPAAMFKLAKPSIDVSIKKADAGSKGGRSGKKSQTDDKQKESKQEAKDKQDESKQQPINDYMINDIYIPPIVPLKEEKANELDTEFETFWKEYPKRKGKDAAKKAFEKVRGQGVELEVLLSAVRLQKDSDQWVKDGGQFIPYPATWLNQGRWQDDTDGMDPPPPVDAEKLFYDGYELEE